MTDDLYACFLCMDTIWQEVDTEGRGSVRRCRGPKDQGCPEDARRLKRARERRSSSAEAGGM